MDAMLCDRCGEVATHFHEDYGNVCQQCARYWTEKELKDSESIDPFPNRPEESYFRVDY
jgi:hypothetical protein